MRERIIFLLRPFGDFPLGWSLNSVTRPVMVRPQLASRGSGSVFNTIYLAPWNPASFHFCRFLDRANLLLSLPFIYAQRLTSPHPTPIALGLGSADNGATKASQSLNGSQSRENNRPHWGALATSLSSIFLLSRFQSVSQDIPMLFQDIYCKDTQEDRGRYPGKHLPVTWSGLLAN